MPPSTLPESTATGTPPLHPRARPTQPQTVRPSPTPPRIRPPTPAPARTPTPPWPATAAGTHRPMLPRPSPPLAAPRPLSPLSTATVTSQTPTLRWALAPDEDGAEVDICRDRACTTRVTTFQVPGAAAISPAVLPQGV